MILSTAINTAMADKAYRALRTNIEADDGHKHVEASDYSLFRIVVVGDEAMREVVCKAIDSGYATVHLSHTEADAIDLIGRGTIPDLIVSDRELEEITMYLIEQGIDEIVPQCTLPQLHPPTPDIVRRRFRDYLPEYALAHFIG